MEKGYAAIPYNLDMRVIWMNKALLDEAGAAVPTDWQTYLDAAAALKKQGIYGYGTGSGAGAYTGQHALVCWMINNGSQFFIVTGDAGVGLPPKYNLFGKVTEGMDVVTAIEEDGSDSGLPETTHTIEKVTISEG